MRCYFNRCGGVDDTNVSGRYDGDTMCDDVKVKLAWITCPCHHSIVLLCAEYAGYQTKVKRVLEARKINKHVPVLVSIELFPFERLPCTTEHLKPTRIHGQTLYYTYRPHLYSQTK